MKKYDSNELKMAIQEITIADFTQNFDKMYKTKWDLFIRLDALCEQLEDMQRELDFTKGQLEAANNELNRTRLRLENLKKYGDENPVEMEAHPSPDEPDDPLPFWDLDHESIAPAEEVEGSDE